MVFRIYVAKKREFANEAKALENETTNTQEFCLKQLDTKLQIGSSFFFEFPIYKYA